ncbi:hypothetical protein ACGF1Z_32420 [Streptomyces sp. NPDC048018]|uniref:hypothetical protein n=1 Tax=Streptomyces sp. NPDC048018 TaxID=3365499 RepID=UPI00371AE282
MGERRRQDAALPSPPAASSLREARRSGMPTPVVPERNGSGPTAPSASTIARLLDSSAPPSA